jgi:hypothetical protein
LQSEFLPATIVSVKKTASRTDAGESTRDPFRPGALVIATLSSPKEKFWGMVLGLAAAGLSLSGAEVASFENLALLVKDGEPFTPAVVFFPMYRVERVELDLPDGGLASLSQRFLAKTGLEPAVVLAPWPQDRASGEHTVRRSKPRPSKERA